jgi:ferritin-like metal-binding protein YciE
MTTVTIETREELTLKTVKAGSRAAEALHAMWQRAPLEELTPEIEQDIFETVRQAREEQRAEGPT